MSLCARVDDFQSSSILFVEEVFLIIGRVGEGHFTAVGGDTDSIHVSTDDLLDFCSSYQISARVSRIGIYEPGGREFEPRSRTRGSSQELMKVRLIGV